ncbi:MAG TPA: hypothetical protein VFZ48_00445 [Candidatus Saccharimonadales bacterium]
MKFGKKIVGALAGLALFLGLSIATTAPAQAGTTYVYHVYHYQVCQKQGHFGASFTNPYNPYSFYCYDLSIPLGVTWAGGLDINGWCASKYAGTHAELVEHNVWGWRCIKRQ